MMKKRFEYYYLPKEYHLKHDYCEFVVNQIEKFITDDTFKHLRQQTINISEKNTADLNEYKGHIFDFFESKGLTKELNLIVANNLLNSLLMETCYFLQEGFLVTMKKRLSVAFTLFRKPFSEILIIYLRLLCEEDFITKFSNDETFNPIALPNQKKKEYLQAINSVLNLYGVEDLYHFLFDKSHFENLYNISNHAIHLYTDKNPVIKTAKQNLNFIFSLNDDIKDQWNYIYDVIPMLLTFLADVTELCVMTYTDVPDSVFIKRYEARYRMKAKCRIK